MKFILVLLIMTAGAVWFFYVRTPRVAVGPSLDEAAALAVAHAKTLAAEARQAVKGAARVTPGQTAGSDARTALDRLLAGEKLREQSRTRETPEDVATKGSASSSYQRLLRGEPIAEVRKQNTPNLRK